mgnify:CR=1 FL=1
MEKWKKIPLKEADLSVLLKKLQKLEKFVLQVRFPYRQAAEVVGTILAQHLLHTHPVRDSPALVGAVEQDILLHLAAVVHRVDPVLQDKVMLEVLQQVTQVLQVLEVEVQVQ